MRETQHILVSREASIRAKQKEDKHHQQGVDMRASWAEQKSVIRNPVDMAQALAEVRTSSVSIPQQLSRYNGSSIYNTPPSKTGR